jgi:hypothetical protein
MRQSPSFAANLIAVVAGTLLLMMNAAFVLVPYALSGHPGEARVVASTAPTYHPT